MSKWEKLLKRLLDMRGDFRFSELQKILEHYGYTARRIGGSHVTFAKKNRSSFTVPTHGTGIVKKVYVEKIRDIVLKEEGDL